MIVTAAPAVLARLTCVCVGTAAGFGTGVCFGTVVGFVGGVFFCVGAGVYCSSTGSCFAAAVGFFGEDCFFGAAAGVSGVYFSSIVSCFVLLCAKAKSNVTNIIAMPIAEAVPIAMMCLMRMPL